jgi:Tol biopolymer transport system component
MSVVMVTGLSGVDAATHLGVGGRNGQILFVASPYGGTPGAARMYVMSPDGGNRHRVITGTTAPWDATFSPDGNRIAFVTSPKKADDRATLYVARADGSRRRLVARESYPPNYQGAGGSISYAWSPSGNRVAYSLTEDARPRLFITDLVAGTRVELVPPEGVYPTSYYSTLTWSPGGRWIGFERTQGDPTTKECCLKDYELVHPNGRGLRRLLHIYGVAQDTPSVSWAPNGLNMAVVTFGFDQRDPPLAVISSRTWRIHRIDARTPLGDTPIWSPDSARLAFAETNESEFRFVSIRPDGTGLRALVRRTVVAQAEFAPDGKRIAVVVAVGPEGTTSNYRNLELIASSGGATHLIARAPRGWEITSLSWQRRPG